MEFHELYTVENAKFEFVVSKSKKNKERYVSTFIKILDDAYIVSIPKLNGKSPKLSLGKKVHLLLYTPEGVFDLGCTVAQIAKECIKVRLTDGVVHTQRRQYARVPINVDMRLKIDEGKKTFVHDVRTINLCAQGTNFNLNTMLESYGKMQVKFTFKNRLIQTFARLAYCNLVYKAQNEEEQDVYSCGIYFTSINHQNSNFLAKECFMYEVDKKKAKYEDPNAKKGPMVTIDADGIMTL